MIEEVYQKSKYLKFHKYQDLISKVSNKVSMQIGNIQPAPPNAVIRSLKLDIVYIVFRHQSWVHAPALTDLTVDFICSEYQLSHSEILDIVEGAIELMLNYVPSERQWTTQEYDREFLRHILVASLAAKSDKELSIDVGFGSGFLHLLSSVAEQESKEKNFVFNSELAELLQEVMTSISSELASTPWIIDFYRLRELFESNSYSPKQEISEQELNQYFAILEEIGWLGIPEKKLAKKPDSDSKLDRLTNLKLVYAESTGRAKTFRLSTLGQEFIAGKIAYQFNLEGFDSTTFRQIPEPIQLKIIEAIDIEKILSLALTCSPNYWHPKSIYLALTRLNQWKSQSALDLLQKLSHNTLNSWAKSEVCAALTNFPFNESVKSFLVTATKDRSAKVREVGRQSLNSWRLRHRNDISKPKQAGHEH